MKKIRIWKPYGWLHKKLISHKLKLVYLRIPKCASKSMVEYIKRYDPDAIYKQSYRKYRGYFRFTVVRNDLERIESAYRHKICNPDSRFKNEFIEKHNQLWWGMPFKNFIEYILRHSDPHWEPCKRFIDANELDKIYTIDEVSKWPDFPIINRTEKPDKSLFDEIDCLISERWRQ